MPKKTTEKSKHELRYADYLHKKLATEARLAGLTNSEMLSVLLKDRYCLKREKGKG